MRSVGTWIMTALKPVTMIALWLALIGVAIVVSAPPIDELVGVKPADWARALGSDRSDVREEAIKRFLKVGPECCPLLEETALHGNDRQVSSVLTVLHEFYRSPRPERYIPAEQVLNRLQDATDPSISLPTAASWLPNRRLRLNRCAARLEALGGSVRIDGSRWDVAPTSDFHRATTATLDADWQGGEEGLKLIERMPDLQVVEIAPAANLSQAAIDALRAERPDLAVIRRGSASMGVEGVERPHGFLVVSVNPGGGAEDAGLEPGDCIIKVGDVSANSFRAVANLIASHSPGDVIPMIIERDETEMKLSVTLRER